MTPASHPERYETGYLGDGVILDLESTVPLADKDKARRAAIAWLARSVEGNPVRIVRINSPRSVIGLKDLIALHGAEYKPDAIIIPLCRTPDEVGVVADILDGPLSTIGIIPMVELARALFAAERIANSHERVSALFLGGGDLARDLHADGSWESLLCARSCIVAAAATRSIAAIDVPYFKSDEAGLATEAAGSRKLGMTAKAALHVEQIATVNAIFAAE
ncbi:aldolase/citrate lyase family protein [Nguyenibacter vanlangensis]|uniref:Aldolase/citrate lyase family protein n=1 Tax=Nguyenibacter vanlangensis TaxID=1216886 RepID=A0ABZ3D052_9PROT